MSSSPLVRFSLSEDLRRSGQARAEVPPQPPSFANVLDWLHYVRGRWVTYEWFLLCVFRFMCVFLSSTVFIMYMFIVFVFIFVRWSPLRVRLWEGLRWLPRHQCWPADVGPREDWERPSGVAPERLSLPPGPDPANQVAPGCSGSSHQLCLGSRGRGSWWPTQRRVGFLV